MSKCSKINKYDTIYKSSQDPGDLSLHTCFVGLNYHEKWIGNVVFRDLKVIV